MDDPEALRQFAFLAAFSAPHLRALAARLPRVRLPAGTPVFRQGEASATMYLIAAGQVRLERTDVEGQAVPLGTLGPPQAFGELALLSGEPRMATVTTQTDCEFVTLDRPLLLALLADAPPEAILAMFAALSQQMRAANEADFRKALAQRTLAAEMEVERQRGLTQMVAGVAHEINTPLGVAGTAASIVARELDRLAALAAAASGQPAALSAALADMREALGLLDGNLQRAHRLVQNFKQLSVSHLQDAPEAFDLPEAVEETLRLAGLGWARRQLAVAFRPALPPEARRWLGYRGYLAQILLNLLANVERYAYPDGGGAAEVTLAWEAPETYALAVRDFGRGMPPEAVERAFEPFFTTGRSRGGTGLGLTIVQHLVTTALQGRIELRSEVGAGTEVVVRFPRTRR